MPLRGSRVLLKQNKPDGFMCVSCAWAKPADPRSFEFCENGAKATTWEITHKRRHAGFFRRPHACANSEAWNDHDLEEAGRLTHPMRWDARERQIRPGRVGRSLSPRSAAS